jgi:hypothetical protein
LPGTLRERWVKECSANVVSLYKSSQRGTWREGSFTGDSERYVKVGTLLGEPRGEAPLPGTLRDRQMMALGTERLSIWELCEGNMEGGLLYWGF